MGSHLGSSPGQFYDEGMPRASLAGGELWGVSATRVPASDPFRRWFWEFTLVFGKLDLLQVSHIPSVFLSHADSLAGCFCCCFQKLVFTSFDF